eukprot:gene19699-25621_t
MASLVPLWFAITLRKKGKCTIAIPEWMSVESLENFIEAEREAQILQPLPFHYIEISKLLLTYAREDIQYPDKSSALLKDLENIRMDRLKIAIVDVANKVKGGEKVFLAKVVNISSMEIFAIKDFITESMSVFKSLTTTKDDNIQPINRKRDNDRNSSNVFDQMDSNNSVNNIQTTNLRRFR